MKERPVDLQGTVIAHNESAKVLEPGKGALDRPAPFVTPQDTSILRWRATAFERCGAIGKMPRWFSLWCSASLS